MEIRKTTLTEKLVISSFALSITIIVILSAFTYNRAKSALLDRTFQQLTSVRVVKSNLLQNFFKEAIHQAKLAANSSEIISLSEFTKKDKYYYLSHSFNDLDNLPPFIRALKRDEFNKVFLVNNEGINIIKNDSNNEQLDFNYFKQLINGDRDLFITQTSQKGNPNLHSVFICKKIEGESKKSGLFVVEISPKSIDNIMLEKSDINGFGISGESYLVGEDFLMRSSSRFIENSIMKTKVKTKAVMHSLQGKSGNSLIKDYRGIDVLSSYSKLDIPDLNWVIIVEIDYSEAMIPINKILYQIVFISIFIFVIVLVITIILSKYITRPIEEINRAIVDIGKGNLDIKLKTGLNDEIGDLYSSINQMGLRLKQTKFDLEKEKKSSMAALIDGQENERRRISRELHDSLGQSLVGMKLKFESCINASYEDAEYKNRLSDMSNLMDKIIEETRRISYNLTPVSLKEFGLHSALRMLCNETSENTSIKIDYKYLLNNKVFNEKEQLYIYRIIQEGLNNIVKHANAENVLVSLKKKSSQIHLEIRDDGNGFKQNSRLSFKGNGLKNIKQRVELLFASINIKSSEGNGCRILIKIPNKNSDNE